MWRRCAALLLATVVAMGVNGVSAEAKTSKFKVSGASRISGVASIGGTLTLKPATFRPKPSKVTYKWTRSGAAISGATGTSVTAKLPGLYRATVTASKSKHAKKTSTSNTVFVPQAEMLSLGSTFGCGVHSDGSVDCWGDGADGQLGDGTTTSRTTAAPVIGLPAPVVQVEGEESQTCALTTTGEVWCWGRDYRGALGTGRTVHPDEYFWDVDVQPVPSKVVGLADKVTALSGTCALLANGKVQCWGDGESGLLGNGSFTSSSTPVTVMALSGVSQISNGSDIACAVTGGKVKCWGWGYFGGLGNGKTGKKGISATPVTVSGITNAVQVQVGALHACALLSTAKVKCWGYNKFGSLGDKTWTSRSKPVHVHSLTGVSTIAVEGSTTCALTAAGAVKCWGLNDGYQLGQNDSRWRNSPIKVKTLGSGAKALYAGSCAVKSDEKIWCWGNNMANRLGVNPSLDLDDDDTDYALVPQPMKGFQP